MPCCARCFDVPFHCCDLPGDRHDVTIADCPCYIPGLRGTGALAHWHDEGRPGLGRAPTTASKHTSSSSRVMVSSSALECGKPDIIKDVHPSTFVALGDPLQDKNRKEPLPRRKGNRSKQRHKGTWFARLLMRDLQGPMHDVMLACSRRRRQSCSPAAPPHWPPALAACLLHLELACSWSWILVGTMIKARHNLLVARLEDRPATSLPYPPVLPSGRVPSSSTFVPHRRTRVCEMQERNLEYRTHLWSPSYRLQCLRRAPS